MRHRRTTPAFQRRSLAAALVLGATGSLAACGDATDDLAAPELIDVATGTAPGLQGVGTLPEPASAWPAAGFDARHSGTSPSTGPQQGSIDWDRTLGTSVTQGPVIGVDGSVIVAADDGVLHALDPATGQDRWTYDAGGPTDNGDLSTSAAVLGDGTILWPGPASTLYALSRSGELEWKETFDGLVLSPAVAGADRVYVADQAGHLSALEITATSHRVVWRVDVGGVDYASPTVGPDGTIYTIAGHDLVAIRDLGDTGETRWRLRTAVMLEVSNAIAPDGTVVLGTNDDQEYGVLPSGTVAWGFPLGTNTYSSSVVSPDGVAYFGDNSGHLWVVDTATGKVRATIDPPAKQSIYSEAVVDADGDYYWVGTTGDVTARDGQDQQLWGLELPEGSNSYPALADGRLYVGTKDGHLVAIG